MCIRDSFLGNDAAWLEAAQDSCDLGFEDKPYEPGQGPKDGRQNLGEPRPAVLSAVLCELRVSTCA
eukprot:13331872-Alexandrium_andersonii.AAC.1